MEFPFYASKVLSVDQDGFAILDAATLTSRSNYLNSGPQTRLQPFAKYDPNRDYLVQILDRMGEASSRAQGLKHVITNYSKFSTSGDNRLYMKIDNNKVCGILKVGQRNLFHYDGYGKVRELRPLCVLDFYVHESVQRGGVGKALLEKMLATEAVEPRKLAYDRPSSKLIAFLNRHYGLSQYTPQNNNYVIFNQYWEDSNQQAQTASRTSYRGYQQTQVERENNVLLNKKNSQTEFHRIGRSVLETANASLFMENNPSRYSYNNNLLSKTMQYPNPKLHENYPGVNQIKNIEELDRKSFGNLNEKTNELQLEKPPLYNAANIQQLKKPHTGSQVPWASHGMNLDSFKSSGAYGSHYTQINFNTWNRR